MISLRQIYAIGVNLEESEMAAFRKRNGGWRAEVCIKGMRASATFTTKREAQAWAAQEETRLREDSAGKIPNKPFRDLLADVSLRMLAPTAEETEKLLHTLGYSREAPPETASARPISSPSRR